MLPIKFSISGNSSTSCQDQKYKLFLIYYFLLNDPLDSTLPDQFDPRSNQSLCPINPSQIIQCPLLSVEKGTKNISKPRLFNN